MRGFVLSDSQRSRITVAEVKEAPFLPILEVTGNVAFNGDSSTQVLSQISGPVSRILVQPGAMVAAGDVLATVSSPDFASAVADYRKAEAAWRNAKRIADRDEELFKNDALARSDLDQARTDLAAAAADLDAAVQQLRALGVDSATIAAIRDGRQAAPVQGVIRAPIAGTVVEKLVTPGQVLEAGATPTFTDCRPVDDVGLRQRLRRRPGAGARGRDRGDLHRRRADAGHWPDRLHRRARRPGDEGDLGAHRCQQHRAGAEARHARAGASSTPIAAQRASCWRRVP